MGFLEVKKQFDEAERLLIEMVGKLKVEIADAVGKQPLRGTIIDDGKSGGPLIVTVKFGVLNEYKNWSPSFFIPMAQADAVFKELERANTASAICEVIRKMVESGYAGRDGNKVYLNPETRRILRESEIDQYVFQTPEIGGVA